MNSLNKKGGLTSALAFIFAIPLILIFFVLTYAYLKSVGLSSQSVDLEQVAVGVDLDYWFANAIASHTDNYVHAFTEGTYGRSSTDTVVYVLEHFATGSVSRYQPRVGIGEPACSFSDYPGRTISCEDFWCEWPVPVAEGSECRGPYVRGNPDYERSVVLQDYDYRLTNVEVGVSFVDYK